MVGIAHIERLLTWLNEQPAGLFHMERKTSVRFNEFGVYPTNSSACQVTIFYSDNWGQIALGNQDFWFDTDDPLVAEDGTKLSTKLTEDEFLSIIQAVWAGKVRERIDYRSGIRIRSYCSIEVFGKEFRKRTIKFISGFLLPATQRVVKNYVSYDHCGVPE